MRSVTGSADAGVKAYGVGSISPVRSFSFSATSDDGSSDSTRIDAERRRIPTPADDPSEPTPAHG